MNGLVGASVGTETNGHVYTDRVLHFLFFVIEKVHVKDGPCVGGGLCGTGLVDSIIFCYCTLMTSSDCKTPPSDCKSASVALNETTACHVYTGHVLHFLNF